MNKPVQNTFRVSLEQTQEGKEEKQGKEKRFGAKIQGKVFTIQTKINGCI